ncbi:DUF4956 domain-containing protein [Proteocatella sphenisci]|uniref:DUF4956 domain-containing protein n=1 Tax=Proteocatella sphenisci TaxID=181070 RepID=UPI0004909616|nr:DUF4956 domain-containing protein [Proteocatella sphenisci]
MLDSLLSTSSAADTITLSGTITIILSSLALGLFISLIYRFTERERGASASFAVTLIMLPSIIAMIILLVGNNAARALSLAGAFSIIRFRSAPGDPKDIGYIFFTLGVGLACGMGYILYGAIFAAILCAAMVILTQTGYAQKKSGSMQLKIMIPEDTDFQHLFDDIFSSYTSSFRLERIKTADFGALFELHYAVMVPDDTDQKEFIDSLRARNGNLNITLSLKHTESW